MIVRRNTEARKTITQPNPQIKMTEDKDIRELFGGMAIYYERQKYIGGFQGQVILHVTNYIPDEDAEWITDAINQKLNAPKVSEEEIEAMADEWVIKNRQFFSDQKQEGLSWGAYVDSAKAILNLLNK